MAAYGPAIKRVNYLLGFSTNAQASPATISGSPVAIFSYDLCIVDKVLEGYRVHPANSSVTTNRHIRAAAMALRANGYRPVLTTGDGYTTYVKG
jgi:hypothetical protein